MSDPNDLPKLLNVHRAAELLGVKTIPSKVKRGVGDAKREEIRFLILSGLPHKEVVLRAKVSSGTVSLIRQEIREVMPLYRNSESAVCVPLACHGGESSSLTDDQVIEKIGGAASLVRTGLLSFSDQIQGKNTEIREKTAPVPQKN